MRDRPRKLLTCLTEEQALAFAEGRLDAGTREALDEHLDRCAECRLLVDEAVDAVRAPSRVGRARRLRTASDCGKTFQVGDLVADRYRVARFIAAGGMGEVYEVEDRLLDVRIALKTIAAELSDDSRSIERLRKEVQLARKVVHPNVCHVFDLATHLRGDEQIYFLTMELLPAPSLGQRLRDCGRLPPEVAGMLASQMAAALAAAHAAGVIHRDFKSDNVLLAPSSDKYFAFRAVVTDFGLALDTLAARDWSRLTSSASFIGSVAYAAPEQVNGGTADAACDVYALGVVLFEMLTGGLPFLGATPLATAAMRLTQPAPRASSRVPGLDPRLDRIVSVCLQQKPDQRFASAEALVRALSPWRSNEVTSGFAGTGYPPTLTFAASNAPSSLGFSHLRWLVVVLLISALGALAVHRSVPPSHFHHPPAGASTIKPGNSVKATSAPAPTLVQPPPTSTPTSTAGPSLAPVSPGKPVVRTRKHLYDIAQIRDQLEVFADGKGHYIALATAVTNGKGEVSARLFWGDRKEMGRVVLETTRSVAIAANDDGNGQHPSVSPDEWVLAFDDPRLMIDPAGSVVRRHGTTTIKCYSNELTLTPLPPDERTILLDSAHFVQAEFYHPYALGRAPDGEFTYVDRDSHGKARIMVGRPGELRTVAIHNTLTTDSVRYEPIFETESGQLSAHFVEIDDGPNFRLTWERGGRPQNLKVMPLVENWKLIFEQLGVYGGRAPSPCDSIEPL